MAPIDPSSPTPTSPTAAGAAAAPPSTHTKSDSLSLPASTEAAPPNSEAPRGLSKEKRGHHRRASSSHRVKETLDAVATRGPEGRRTVNQYTLGPELGKGAFGTVELGVDLQTGEKYAVKEYSKARLRRQIRQRSMQDARGRGGGRGGGTVLRELEDEAEKNPLSLIAREVAVMKQLDHPNLVHLYEVLDVPLSDGLFMVLEYCPGGILLDLPPPSQPSNPHMDLSLAKAYFGQILMALEYLHENGIAHRDIKPENILLTIDKQTAKMCDFGVSEMFAKKGDDRVRKGMGSPAFMSPESIEGGHEMGAKMADIWALGVTLYCMLTGHLPFNYDSPMELFEAIKTEEIKIPSHWPEAQKSLVLGMLDRNVERRLTVEGIRNHPWMTDADLPSKEDNLSEDRMVREPTADEIKKAVRSVSSAFAVIRAVQKFKRLTASKRYSRASSIDSSVFSSSSAHSSPLLQASSPLSSPPLHISPLAPCHPTPSLPHPEHSPSSPKASTSSHLASPPPPSHAEIADEISDEPQMFDEPEEVVHGPPEINEPQQYDEPEEVEEPEEDESLFSSPPTSNGPPSSSSRQASSSSRQPSMNVSSPPSTSRTSNPGIADELSDEPASMGDEEGGGESQETVKARRPKLGLQLPTPTGLSEKFGRLGMVIVESPGGGREEIG